MKKHELIVMLACLTACQNAKQKKIPTEVDNTQYMENQKLRDKKQFFADNSFWNQPMPKNTEIDPKNNHFIELLKSEPTFKWNIPIFEVDSATPTYNVQLHTLDNEQKKLWDTKRKTFGHGSGFGNNVPIPDIARQDEEQDAHMVLIDWDRMLAWDMWRLYKQANGTYESSTGMKYPLNGSGTFKVEDFAVKTERVFTFTDQAVPLVYPYSQD